MNADFTYLHFAFLFLLVLGVFLFFAGPHRKISLIAGSFYVCVLPLYLPFEHEYWTPARLGGGILGIEDVLLLFAFGACPWATVGSIVGKRLSVNLKWRGFLLRYGGLALVGMGIFLTLWVSGCSAISSSIGAQLLISMLVLVLRPNLWPLAALGLVVVTPQYLAILKISYWLLPEFRGIWNPEIYGGATLFGLPLGEVLWISSGSWGYPVAIGYIVNARLEKSCSKDSVSVRLD